jgi:hypothetical protein
MWLEERYEFMHIFWLTSSADRQSKIPLDAHAACLTTLVVNLPIEMQSRSSAIP